MTEAFIQALRTYFTSHPFTDEHLSDTMLYAYDSKADRRTFMTADEGRKDEALRIDNPNGESVCHICIDGGIVEYGLERYQDDGEVHERCDCMVFTEAMLHFVEFKMNALSTADKTVWHNCSDAMRAIRDFVTYMYRVFPLHNDDFLNYFPLHAASAIVCIKQEPGMHPKRNSQRLTEKDKFTAATKLKVDFTTICTL